MAGTTDREAAPPYAGHRAPEFDLLFLLMEAHFADQPTRDVYQDLKRTAAARSSRWCGVRGWHGGLARLP